MTSIRVIDCIVVHELTHTEGDAIQGNLGTE